MNFLYSIGSRFRSDMWFPNLLQTPNFCTMAEISPFLFWWLLSLKMINLVILTIELIKISKQDIFGQLLPLSYNLNGHLSHMASGKWVGQRWFRLWEKLSNPKSLCNNNSQRAFFLIYLIRFAKSHFQWTYPAYKKNLTLKNFWRLNLKIIEKYIYNKHLFCVLASSVTSQFFARTFHKSLFTFKE